MSKTTVAVLRGGPSSEYEVSMRTGAGVLSVLKEEPVNVRDIVITRHGEWLVNGYIKNPEQALLGVDVAFNAMHGEFGEDGQVQRILERYGVAYTGSRPFPSSRAMNKQLTKEHLKAFNVKMPKHMRVEKGTDPLKAAHTISGLFGREYFVKPVCGGSSFHTFTADSIHLPTVLEKAFAVCDAVLVEERVRGKEATVGVLEGYRGKSHYVMPVIEIVPPHGKEYFDLEAKYSGLTDEIVPGRFSKAERELLSLLAKDVHTHMELRHISRSDFIVAADGVYFLEVNTLPGLTDQSLFPKAMTSVGGSYRDLIVHLLALAQRDGVNKK